MKRYPLVGYFLILTGAIIALYPQLRMHGAAIMTPYSQDECLNLEKNLAIQSQVTLTPNSSFSIDPAKTISLNSSTQKNRTYTDNTYIDYLAERALREAESAALKSTRSFMKEMMSPVEGNDNSFAEKLYSIGANARSLFKSESDYRDYVSKRFLEEITQNIDIKKNLDAVAFEYTDRLKRIAQIVAIESGLDVTNLPSITNITFKGLDGVLCKESWESTAQLSSTIQDQSKQGTDVQIVLCEIGLLMPTTLIVDLAIGLGFDTVANSFRDPVGKVAIDSHQASEALAERICFGSNQYQGIYSYLLDIAHDQNSQLRDALRESEACSSEKDINTFFETDHE